MNQQQSELQLLEHPIAAAMRVFPVLTGLSVAGFGIALLVGKAPRMAFTALAALLVGASMVSNGVFVAGNPLHGLYGLTLFCVLVPACFAAELPRGSGIGSAGTLSLAVAFVSLVYLWLMISGLHPHGMRGLGQRVALIVIFGWYSYAGWVLLRLLAGTSEETRLGAGNRVSVERTP